MKKALLTAALLVATLPLSLAQDSLKVKIRPYGFVRNYLTFDSRKTYCVTGGEYNMQPYDIDTVDGVDLNDVPSMQLQALTSRFGLEVSGPRFRGWTFGGRLEGDFGGFGDHNTVLRLRLAYMRMARSGDRVAQELVVGQDWHPMSGSIMPDVLGMASGAPFRPHSRAPQVRATMYWGSVGYTAALLWQLQYMNNGPKGATDSSSTASVSFAHNALWPEAFLGLNFRQGGWYAQVGVDAQLLRPRMHAQVGGTMRRVDETVASISPTLYAQYVADAWSVKFRTLLAQNTSHLNQLVGYAVTAVGQDGTWSYKPMNATISYLNVAWRVAGTADNGLKANLFLGYMKNLGAGTSLHDFGGGRYRIYMKGGEEFVHLNSLWRVAPSLSYSLKAVTFGVEYELTAATYGDIASDGSVALNENLRNVMNHRVCAMVRYSF